MSKLEGNLNEIQKKTQIGENAKNYLKSEEEKLQKKIGKKISNVTKILFWLNHHNNILMNLSFIQFSLILEELKNSDLKKFSEGKITFLLTQISSCKMKLLKILAKKNSKKVKTHFEDNVKNISY